MKNKTYIQAILFPIFLLAIFAFSLPVFAQTIVPPSTVINDTWTPANSPYIVDGEINFRYGTLTIEPGTIIKFNSSTSSLSFHADVTLTANGTEEQPIYFTSIKDDSLGGDTNGDGNTTLPAVGDWGYFSYGEGAYNRNLEISNVRVRYGGGMDIGNNIYPSIVLYFNWYSGIPPRDYYFQNIEVSNSKTGLYAYIAGANKLHISQSSFHDNQDYGVYSEIPYLGEADFANNWWGNVTGPYHSIQNPTGAGNPASLKTQVIPWLTVDPMTEPSHQETLDPVIIIPGIMGSWNMSGEWVLDPIFSTYDNLWEAFKLAGYEEGVNLFAFPYQWRLSNSYTATLLKDKIEEVKAICECDKVDLVAHSMGGLVARAYIEGNDYQSDIDQLIFLATPHKGSTKSYLTWEGGEMGQTSRDFVFERIFKVEAELNGYGGVFQYVRGLPMQSVQELLPIYDYLRDKDTMQLREYPNNYPVNTFLELLNEPIHLTKLNSVNMTNMLAGAGASSTIDNLRVVDEDFTFGEWEHGYPENYSTPFTDHGLEYGAGDKTVPERSNKDFVGLENVVIESDHHFIVTDAQKQIIKELTGTEPQEEVRLNIFQKYLMVRIFSPADFVIIAPDGKRLGKDFINEQEINEIQGAFYSGFSGDIEFALIPNPMDGEYTIELQGTGEGEYRLSVSYIDDEKDIDSDFVGIIETDQIKEFNINYEEEAEDPIDDLEITASIDSTIEDIEAIYAEGWITKESVKKILIKEFTKLKKKLDHSSKQKEHLNEKKEKIIDNPKMKEKTRQKLLDKIDEQIEKLEQKEDKIVQKQLNKIEKKLNKFYEKEQINQKGYDILIADINYLRINL